MSHAIHDGAILYFVSHRRRRPAASTAQQDRRPGSDPSLEQVLLAGHRQVLRPVTRTSASRPPRRRALRRQFAKLTALGLAGLLSSGLDPEWVDAVLAGAPLDRRSLADLQQLNREYGRMSWTISPYTLRAVLRRHLAWLNSHLNRNSGSARHDLLSVIGEATSLLGQAEFRCDSRGDAEVLLNRALRIADESGDERLQTATMVRLRSYYSMVPSGGRAGNPKLSMAIAEEAMLQAGPSTPPALRAWLLVSRAEEYAFHERETEARHDLELAEQAFAKPGEREGYLSHWTSDVIDGWRGNIEMMLGDGPGAVITLERVRDRMPSTLISSYAPVVADVAAAYALQGEVDHACAMLEDAARYAVAAKDPIAMRRIEGIRMHRLGRWEYESPVLRLDDQLRTAWSAIS